MGGSGGFYGYGSVNVQAKTTSSASNAEVSQREIDINEFLEGLLKGFNGRDAGAIQKHLSEIEKVLSREIEGLDKILFGGSVSKNTFIEGTSDVDALVFLDNSRYKDVKPKELQNAFVDLLKKRFPNTPIEKGTLAVTLKFKDYEIQLLPALKSNGKVKIANRDNTAWSAPINTSAFTKRLTKVNQANSNKVVPVIKLAKNLFEKLPKECKLSGYHVEALAVEAFTAYSGRHTLYDMTKHLLEHASRRVLNPIQDVTGQSGIVDDYLGTSKSLSRQKVSHYIEDIHGRFSNSVVSVITNELFT